MPRGYMRLSDLKPRTPDIIIHRRGPRRGTIDESHRARMMAYMEGEGKQASYPEATVYYELVQRRLQDGVHFDFQSSVLGGRLELGGAVVDFKFLDRPLALRIMGEYWHPRWQAMGLGLRDEEQRLVLEGLGWTVKDLWESEVLDLDRLEAWLRANIDTPIVQHGMP